MRWWLLGLVIPLASCAPDVTRIPEPTPEMALAMGVDEREMQRGYQVYVDNCAKCHERVPPGETDPEAWREIVPHMAVRAKLSEQDESEALIYLLAAHGTVHGANLQH